MCEFKKKKKWISNERGYKMSIVKYNTLHSIRTVFGLRVGSFLPVYYNTVWVIRVQKYIWGKVIFLSNAFTGRKWKTWFAAKHAFLPNIRDRMKKISTYGEIPGDTLYVLRKTLVGFCIKFNRLGHYRIIKLYHFNGFKSTIKTTSGLRWPWVFREKY